MCGIASVNAVVYKYWLLYYSCRDLKRIIDFLNKRDFHKELVRYFFCFHSVKKPVEPTSYSSCVMHVRSICCIVGSCGRRTCQHRPSCNCRCISLSRNVATLFPTLLHRFYLNCAPLLTPNYDRVESGTKKKKHECWREDVVLKAWSLYSSLERWKFAIGTPLWRPTLLCQFVNARSRLAG